jgi:hypothetical protein
MTESAMEQRRVDIPETDVTSLGVLLGVVAAAFIALGVVIYFFGEDQSSLSAANNPPPQTQRSMKTPAPAEPSTVGQGGSNNK